MSTPASPNLNLTTDPTDRISSTLSPTTPSRPVARRTATLQQDDPPPYAATVSSAAPAPPPPVASSSRPTRSISATRPASASSSHTLPNPMSVHPPLDSYDLPSASSSRSRRQWLPTRNVPLGIADRHSNMFSSGLDGADEGRHRWLSEDEGAGGVSRAFMSRRRRRSSHGNDHPPDDPSPPRPPPVDGTSSVKLPKTSIEALSPPKRTTSQRRSRPHVRRARSFEPQIPHAGPSRPPVGATDVTVGTLPPRIEDLVPTPSSPAKQVEDEARSVDPARIEPSDKNRLPDFAPGRGGDGIGGADMPGADTDTVTKQAMSQREERSMIVDKIRRLLGCALCPPVDGKVPSLHHPITLPCGHTLSSSHIPIPAPPPLQPTSDLPHEVFAAQQRQHQQRLNIWASVMCPIPTCKRYSPIAANTVIGSKIDLEETTSTHSRSSSGQGETLASGVMYYPPAVTLPAYSADAPVLPGRTETNTTLLDVTVDKILKLVERELITGSPDAHTMRDTADLASTDTESEDESRPGPMIHSNLSGDMATLGRDTPEHSRTKRRRDEPPLHRRLRQTGQQGDSDDWTFRKDLHAIVECDVCAMMLFDPVTTPCQHSFCSKCLSRSLDHSSRCPVCRQDLPSFAFFQDHAVNRVLLAVIKIAFAEEYAERQRAIEREERDALLDTPIFVCTLAFPGMPTILHVFEPRYRLMIRRCIESSSPRFGMVLPSRGTGAPGTQGLMEYGTMLEIQSVQMLPDGRSMVETVGSYRFKLLEKGNLDGYTVGRIERIDDISPEEDLALEQAARANASNPLPNQSSLQGQASHTVDPSGVSQSLSAPVVDRRPLDPALSTMSGLPDMGSVSIPMSVQTSGSGSGSGTSVNLEDDNRTTEEYMNICRSFIDQLRSGSAPWLLQRLNNTYGSMPTDPSEFSYWMALVMPIDEYEKAKLLPIRSPRLRLKLLVHWVESLRSSWWFSSGCVVG